MANKYYAVKKGHKTGLFNTWVECQKAINGFSGAEYKSFKLLEDANTYLGIKKEKTKTKNIIDFSKISISDNKVVDVYVDGSYKNGRYSYGLAVVYDGKIIHTENGVGQNKEAASINNVAGELSAAMHAIEWCKNHNLKCKIYHDYEGIGAWFTGKWKAKNPLTKKYVEFMNCYTDVIDCFVKIKGHSNISMNDLVDSLAKKALEEVV